MKIRKLTNSILAVVLVLSSSVFTVTAASGKPRQDPAGGTVSVLVTPHAHDVKTTAAAGNLTADDFAVRENDIPQTIISAKPASHIPTFVEVLIQDNLVSRVNNELAGLKDFIRSLPEGSSVLTGYLTTGTLSVTQDFTTDRESAARSLRIVTGRAPYNPYVELIEALKKFDSQPQGRRIVVLVSDGLDLSHGFEDANPEQSIDLQRSIKEAQNREVAVYSVYVRTRESGRIGGLELNFGQGSLMKLSDSTGGEAFLGTGTLVSLTSYWRDIKNLLGQQWLVTYRSTASGSGYQRIKISAESGLHLHYQSGYWIK